MLEMVQGVVMLLHSRAMLISPHVTEQVLCRKMREPANARSALAETAGEAAYSGAPRAAAHLARARSSPQIVVAMKGASMWEQAE